MQIQQRGTRLSREFAPPPAGPHRILVLKLDHFGDFVIAMPAFERLRQSFPDSHITLICGAWNRQSAEASKLFDAVHAFNYFPENAKNWSGVPQEPVERFDELAAGPYHLALDLRVDGDTRFLLNRVKARMRGGIGSTAAFPYLDIALPLGHQPWLNPQRQPVELLTLPVDRFVSRLRRCDGVEPGGDLLVGNFWITNTCLLRSEPVSLPLARCRVRFAVGLRGLGFARLRARMSFDVLQNGQVVAERVFAGRDMSLLAGGAVTLDFDSNIEGSRFEFRVHAIGRPLKGRFTFGGLRVESVQSLMHPRYQPVDVHIGERLSLLVVLAEDRSRDLYADPTVGRIVVGEGDDRLPPDLIAAFDGPDSPGSIVIAPVSNSSVRDWPLDRYGELVGLLLAQSRYRIVLIGTADQAAMLDRLRQGHAISGLAAAGRVVSLAGRTPWLALPALLHRAALVICNNSGIAHLAAASGVRTLAIYSASHRPQEWGPRGRHARTLMAEVPCSPCGLEDVAACQFGHACMTRITPAQVCAEALDMMGAAAGAPVAA